MVSPEKRVISPTFHAAVMMARHTRIPNLLETEGALEVSSLTLAQ
jgi:hypothetical protein